MNIMLQPPCAACRCCTVSCLRQEGMTGLSYRRTTAPRVDRECLCMKTSLRCRSQSLLSSETRGRNSSYIFDCSRNILSTIPFFHQKGTTRQPFFTFSTKKALPASHFSLFPNRHYPPAIFPFFHKKTPPPPPFFPFSTKKALPTSHFS